MMKKGTPKDSYSPAKIEITKILKCDVIQTSGGTDDEAWYGENVSGSGWT